MIGCTSREAGLAATVFARSSLVAEELSRLLPDDLQSPGFSLRDSLPADYQKDPLLGAGTATAHPEGWTGDLQTDFHPAAIGAFR